MSKRFAVVLAVLITAVALLGATGCSKKKMMMGSANPVSNHLVG